LQNAACRHAAAERHSLLQPQVDPMNRLAHERIARNDRPVLAIPVHGPFADVTVQVAGGDLIALTRSVEIHPAHLEPAARLEDAVEYEPMTLVGSRQRVLVPEI